MSHQKKQQIQIPYLNISADEKAFIQHKICFKQCIKNMKVSGLDAQQTECVKNCLFKFNAVERLMIEKMRQVMEGFVGENPELRRAIEMKNKEIKME